MPFGKISIYLSRFQVASYYSGHDLHSVLLASKYFEWGPLQSFLLVLTSYINQLFIYTNDFRLYTNLSYYRFINSLFITAL